MTAIPASAIDVILTLDRSLSMMGNDPRRDSIKGAELFSELLSADDRLGLTTFAENSELLLPLTALTNRQVREQIAALIGKVSMNGIRTNFDAALRVAYPLFPKPTDPAHEHVLVLFSDGQLNLGSEEANDIARNAITNELIPNFRAAGIRVLGVAFSQEADLSFLQRLADATNGHAFQADKPADIYDAFVRLFEQTDQPLTAPVINGKVTVDANVRELKLLVKRGAGDAPMQLTDPSGRNLNAGDQLPGVDWNSTPYFDRVTIQQPEAGDWKVTADNADKRVYIESDLDLQIIVPIIASLDETVNLTAKLTYRGVAIDSELMKSTRFSAQVLNPSSVISQQIELQPDHTALNYRGTLRFNAPGTYAVQITAKGVDFERRKSSDITVVTAESPRRPVASTSDIPPAPRNPDGIDTPGTQSSAIMILLSGNLAILVLIGLGIWWWRHQHARIDLNDDDLDGDR